MALQLKKSELTCVFDMCIGEETYSYILDAGQEKSWASIDNGATLTASDFTTDWTAYGTLFSTFTDKLVEQGNLNKLTYTTDTSSISIYSVSVDPNIPESTFATS